MRRSIRSRRRMSPTGVAWEHMKRSIEVEAVLTVCSQVAPAELSSATRVEANTMHFPCKKKMATEDSGRDTVDPTLSFLDLPDLVLECILWKLPPSALLTMSHVCKSLRRTCTSDHMWGSHMERKWGKLLGPSTEKERRIYFGSKDHGHRKCEDEFRGGKQKGLMMVLMRAVSAAWPCSWAERRSWSLANDSVVHLYLELENGRFWFPAQVYCGEISCHDAEICYDFQTDTFKARYPPHRRRAMTLETGVTWERVRPPPTEISNLPHDLHSSDCLKDLRPGDSFEIQWKKNKGHPYGWWYGVIGHLESCNHQRSRNLCQCHDNDDVVLEFNQYSPYSRWRRVKIKRRNHRLEGNKADGFYGGIRKLKEEEISAWKKLWPDELLE